MSPAKKPTKREQFDAAWDMSNDLAGGFDDVPTTTGKPPRIVAPLVTPSDIETEDER